MLCPGRSVSLLPFFPHTRIPGSRLGIFVLGLQCTTCPVQGGIFARAPWEGGFILWGPSMWVNR